MVRNVLGEMGMKAPQFGAGLALSSQVDGLEFLHWFELHQAQWERQYPAYLLDAFTEEPGFDVVSQSMDIVSSFGSVESVVGLSLAAKSELLHIRRNLELAVGPVLDSLDGLVSAARGCSFARRDRNPLRPENYVLAMQKMVFASSQGKEPMAIMVLKQFGAVIAPQLARTYALVVTALGDAGVEPAPKRSVALSRMTAGKMGLSYIESEAPSGTERYVTKDTLLQGLGKSADHFVLEQATGSLGLDLLNAPAADVSSVQGLSAAEAGAKPAYMAKPGRPDFQVQAVINKLVHLPPIKVQMTLLQPSLRHLIQTDPEFLRDAQHPARIFLRLVQDAGEQMPSVKDPGFAVLDQALRSAVVAGDLAKVPVAKDFKRACDVLRLGTMEPRTPQRISSQATTQAMERKRKPRLKLDANAVLLKVTARAEAHALFATAPLRVQRFAKGPWAKVVTQTLIDSLKVQALTAQTDIDALIEQDPKQYMALLPLLFASVQAKQLSYFEADTLRRIKEMHERICDGLLSVGLPQDKVAAVVDKLKEMHRQALNDASAEQTQWLSVQMPFIAPANASVDARDGTEVPKAARQTQAVGGGSLHMALPRLTRVSEEAVQPQTLPHIEVGQWLAWEVQSAQRLRTQLSWVSPDQTFFMFTAVDGSHQTMTRRRLTALYTQGLMRFVAPE